MSSDLVPIDSMRRTRTAAPGKNLLATMKAVVNRKLGRKSLVAHAKPELDAAAKKAAQVIIEA